MAQKYKCGDLVRTAVGAGKTGGRDMVIKAIQPDFLGGAPALYGRHVTRVGVERSEMWVDAATVSTRGK